MISETFHNYLPIEESNRLKIHLSHILLVIFHSNPSYSFNPYMQCTFTAV